MPRYYFRIPHDEPSFDEDDGIELPDLTAAWEEATRACGEMMQEIDGQLSTETDWRMDVHGKTAEAGQAFRAAEQEVSILIGDVDRAPNRARSSSARGR
jgi:hypothetical protein